LDDKTSAILDVKLKWVCLISASQATNGAEDQTLCLSGGKDRPCVLFVTSTRQGELCEAYGQLKERTLVSNKHSVLPAAVNKDTAFKRTERTVSCNQQGH
jgi:hypothetical protein